LQSPQAQLPVEQASQHAQASAQGQPLLALLLLMANAAASEIRAITANPRITELIFVMMKSPMEKLLNVPTNTVSGGFWDDSRYVNREVPLP
jgi:hypothetical protein